MHTHKGHFSVTWSSRHISSSRTWRNQEQFFQRKCFTFRGASSFHISFQMLEYYVREVDSARRVLALTILNFLYTNLGGAFPSFKPDHIILSFPPCRHKWMTEIVMSSSLVVASYTDYNFSNVLLVGELGMPPSFSKSPPYQYCYQLVSPYPEYPCIFEDPNLGVIPYPSHPFLL